MGELGFGCTHQSITEHEYRQPVHMSTRILESLNLRPPTPSSTHLHYHDRYHLHFSVTGVDTLFMHHA